MAAFRKWAATACAPPTLGAISATCNPVVNGTIERARINRQSRRVAGLARRTESKGPMARNEGALNFDAGAGRSAQSDRVPVVEHSTLPLRHEEHQMLRRATGLVRGDGAYATPFGPRHAAQKAPSTTYPKALSGRLGASSGSERIHEDKVGIVGPQLILKLRIDEGAHPMMNADNAIEPRQRHIMEGKRAADARELRKTGLIASEAL